MKCVILWRLVQGAILRDPLSEMDHIDHKREYRNAVYPYMAEYDGRWEDTIELVDMII